MADFLAGMASASQARVDALLSTTNTTALRREAEVTPAPHRLSLQRFDLIAEFKPAAPSAGTLVEADPLSTVTDRVQAYAQAGAAAISVLTEPTRFGGSLPLLREAARITAPYGVPVMRKDFLVHPAQVAEARLWGASGVLLIVRMLDDQALHDMCALALDLSLFVLIEAFDADELRRAAPLAALARPGVPVLFGVNTRDLRTLEVVPTRLRELAPQMPPGAPAVAESGLLTPQDAANAAVLGYQLGLVGTALMRAPDGGALARAMIDAGRAACS